MKVIQLPKGSGKTVVAIRQSLIKKCPLIVPTGQDIIRVKGIINSLVKSPGSDWTESDADAMEIITYREFLDRYKAGEFRNQELVFDDYDKMLGAVYDVDPDKLTITVGY